MGGSNRVLWLAFLLMPALLLADKNEEKEEKEEFQPAKFIPPNLSSKPFFFDYFSSTSKIGDRWIASKAKKEEADAAIAKYDGKWAIGPPSEISIDGDHGLIVLNKAKHHAIAAPLDQTFQFIDGGKPLIVQYEVQFEEGQECGGGYIKLLSEGAERNLQDFQDKTPYTIMFGPDKCGPAGKVHLIFKYRNPKNGSIDEYHAKQPDNIGASYWDDHKTHLYTLSLKSTGDYEVKIDQRSLFYGNMLKNVNPSITPPEIIADPEDKKPEDWDERAEIDDETAVKPEDWDESQPKEVLDESAQKPSDWIEEEQELIPDPEAVRPNDWDEDMDGEWEPPMINNPACEGKSGCGPWKRPAIPNPLYKGKWRRPKVANPAYKGIWKAREIENPHYFQPIPFEGLAPITALGLELWTMSERIIFDNILVTDDQELADEVAVKTFAIRRQEAERFTASKGDNSGIWHSVTSAFDERPWLFFVVALCVILPAIGIAVCCFGRKSSSPVTSADALRKKTDAIIPDDEMPQLDGSDEDEGEGEEGDEHQHPQDREHEQQQEEKESRSRHSSQKSEGSQHSGNKPRTYADLEDDSSEDSNMEIGYEEDDLVKKGEKEEEDGQETHPTEEIHIPQTKTNLVKRKPRKDQ